MRYAWLIALVIVLSAAPGVAQLFEGTHLDPFTSPYPAPPLI